ncbi:MAG TPA: CHAD domain-containing protein [Sphingobacteriaceae bacterium]
MQRDNFLIIHWESEKNLFLDSLDAFDVINPELIHKIRVNIKKLRTYLSLYGLLYKNKFINDLFKETEQLFSVLGQYRNFDILKENIDEDLNKDPILIQAYLAWLQTLQAELPSLSDTLSHYKSTGLDQISAVFRRTIGRLDSIQLGRKTVSINRHLLKKVRVYLDHFKLNFHEIRKDLKRVFYHAKISTEVGISVKQLDLLNKTLDILGKIQDDEERLRFVHRYRKSTGIIGKSEELKSAELNIKLKKSAWLRKAKRSTLRFLDTFS